MTRIGIIGTENTRSADLARLCNRDQRLPMQVTHLWGESPRQANIVGREMGVSNVLKDWRKMAGEVDGVVVAQRAGSQHYPVARWFLEQGVPVFVDKPLTENLAQARKLFDLSERTKTPLGTCSALVLQRSFRAWIGAARKLGAVSFLNASGPADVNSPYGGIFFYGIHQVDTVVEVLGTEVRSARLINNGAQGLGVINFSEGRIATLNCVAGRAEFHWRVCAEKGSLGHRYRPDAERNLGIAKAIRHLIRGEEPASRARMLAPIAILEALRKSQRSGREERVPSLEG